MNRQYKIVAGCIAAIFSTTGITGCGGGGNPASPGNPGNGSQTIPIVPQAKLIYTGKAASTFSNEPGMAAQAAVLLAIASDNSGLDATPLDSIFANARQRLATDASYLVGSNLDFQVRMFSLLNEGLRDKLPDSAATVHGAMRDLLDDVIGFESGAGNEGARDLKWESLKHAKIAKLAGDLYDICAGNSKNATVCDAVLSKAVGLSVKSTVADMCRVPDGTPGCDAATASPDVETERARLMSQRKEVLTKLNSGISDCIAGKDDCVLETREQVVKSATSIINYVADKATLIDLASKKDTEEGRQIGLAMVNIYQNVGKFYDAYKSVHSNWEALADGWSDWKDVIFKADKFSDVIGAIEGIGGAINGISGGIMTMFSVFSHSNGKIEKATLDQVAELLKLVNQLRTEMHGRFDIIDGKLDNLYVTMTDGLNTITTRTADLATAVSQVQTGIDRLESQINQVSSTMEAYFSDLSREELNDIQGNARPITQEEFDRELAKLFNWMLYSTDNSLHAGVSNRDYNDGVAAELNGYPLAFNVNYLAQYPSQVFGTAAMSGQRLANPSELNNAMRMYTGLISRYPEYAKRSAVTLSEQIRQLRDRKFIPISNLVTTLQNQPELYGRLINDYLRRLRELQVAIDNWMLTYLRTVSPTGRDFSQLDLWADADQQSAYVPTQVRNNTVPPCSGSSPALTLPDNWRKVFSSNLAINAELLGIANSSACYSLDPSGAGGWSNLQLVKIKVDRYYAWGALSARIHSYSGQTLVSSRLLQVPQNTSQWSMPNDICFFFTKDDIRVAPSSVPAANVLAAAWTGTFWPNSDWCYGGYRPQNLRALFESSSQPIWDWVANDPTASAAARASVQASLASLRKGFNTAVAVQLANGSEVALAARRLEGARLALERFLELGTPQLIRDNYAVHGAFFGSQRLPGKDDLIARFATAGAAAEPAKVDFVTKGMADSETLRVVLDRELGRVAKGEIKYGLADLEATRIEMDILLDMLATRH